VQAKDTKQAPIAIEFDVNAELVAFAK